MPQEQYFNRMINKYVRNGLISINDERIPEFKKIYFDTDVSNLIKHFIVNNVYSNLHERCRQHRLYNSIHKKGGSSKEKMLIMYEKEVALIRWDSYCKKQAEVNSFEYKQKKYGMTREEFNSYNKSRSTTKKNFIRRHGEIEGSKKWDEYCKRQAYAGCSKEYFIEKYGKEEGSQRWLELNEKKKQNLNNFIKRYGEKEGIERYEIYISRPFGAYSLISQELFWKIFERLPKHIQNKCYFAELNKEYGKLSSNGYYKFDFCISSLKYIIEFNGTLYHGDYRNFSPDDIPPTRGDNLVTAEQMWETDYAKYKFIHNLGFVVDYVWEIDYNNDKDAVVNKIIDKIKLLADISEIKD
jgi:hypothetical protein